MFSEDNVQQIIDHAMKFGVLKQRNVVGVITGLMGSGKSCLVNRLFNKPIEKRYTSTGVIKESVRGLLHHIGHISAKEWKLLSPKNICEYLAPLIKSGMEEANVEELAHCLIMSLDPSLETAETDLSPTDLSPTDLSPTDPTSKSSPPLAAESPTGKKIYSMIKSAVEYSQIDMLQLAHMIDTGGQPELMEVMPSLIHNANLAILVINLLYGLDDYPKLDYHEKGVPYEHQYQSRYSCRDVILKLASTLHAKKSRKAGNPTTNFHLLVVATHPDCVKGDVEACIEKLNHELESILLPAFNDELIAYEENKIAFVLNLKNPDDADQEKLALIRKKISDPKLGSVRSVPSSFFMFEQDILERAKKVKRDILTLDECMQVGARLEMGEEAVIAALIMLHCQNTFLYFRKVLPNHIFVRPQVPLDIVNGVIRFSYKLSAGEVKGFPHLYSSMLKEGIISEDLLGFEDQISSHFKPGIYEPRDAIALLCHTFTMAPLHQEAKGDNNRQKYLMICLKPPIPDEELSQYLPESSPKAQLVFKFSSGCVPLGCYGSTITCLVSLYKWEVIKKDGRPMCLGINAAALHVPGLLVDIILLDCTHHLELHVDPSNRDPALSEADVFTQIHEKILSAIKQVFSTMCLNTDQITISPAVFCGCSDKSKDHFAVFEEHNGKQYLRCDSTNDTYSPTPEQLFWVGKSLKKRTNLDDSPGIAILVTCDYRDLPDLGTLDGIINDAEEMAETFHRLRFATHVLKNPKKADIKAKLKEVSDYLGTFSRKLTLEEGKTKVIIFAFSGHGRSVGTAEKIIANDGESLDTKDEVVLPLVKHENIFEIPKLFFIDACRGASKLLASKGEDGAAASDDSEVTKSEGVYYEKLYQQRAGNYRIDYATIPNHVSFAGEKGSMWMPKLACAMREYKTKSFQEIVAIVNADLHSKLEENKQQCETVGRLNCGPLIFSKLIETPLK